MPATQTAMTSSAIKTVTVANTREMPVTAAPFLGDFDLLPIRAHLDHGAVPRGASSVDFDNAMTAAIVADPFTMEGAATIWHGEAIRWRRGNPDVALDLAAVGALCAKRLREMQAEVLNPGARWASVREAHRALYRELAAEGLLDGRGKP